MTYPVQGLVIPEVLVRTRSQTALSLLFSTILPVTGMEIHKHINSAPPVGCVNTWTYIDGGVFF